MQTTSLIETKHKSFSRPLIVTLRGRLGFTSLGLPRKVLKTYYLSNLFWCLFGVGWLRPNIQIFSRKVGKVGKIGKNLILAVKTQVFYDFSWFSLLSTFGQKVGKVGKNQDLAVKTQVFWGHGSKTPVFSQLKSSVVGNNQGLAVKTQVFWSHWPKTPVFSQLKSSFFRLFRLLGEKLRFWAVAPGWRRADRSTGWLAGQLVGCLPSWLAGFAQTSKSFPEKSEKSEKSEKIKV